MNHIAGLVLAGGRASRLGGGDKALLDIGGRPILARIVAAIAPEVAALAIGANGDPARFAGFGLPVLPDPPAFARQGPLAGLAAGLDWAAGQGAAALLTVPGDTPFLPSGLAAALAPAPAFAARAGRDHPLIALWPVTCRFALQDMLRTQPGRAVAHFGEIVGIRRVGFPVGGRDPFLNVNTQRDLDMARSIAERAE